MADKPLFDTVWRTLGTRFKRNPPRTPLIADVLEDPTSYGFTGIYPEMMMAIHKEFAAQGVMGTPKSKHNFHRLFDLMVQKKMKEELL